MKNSRFQYGYRSNASSLHRKVGETLRTSTLFSGYQIYQEYPVCRVNPGYDETSHHFDWVIMGIDVVIECHGKQHYEAVDFSGKAEDGGIGALQATRRRDNQKREAALEAGFTYIEIPYTAEKTLTEQYIWDLYKENLNEAQRLQPVQKEPTDYHRQRLAAAREYRKDQYARAKARRVEVQSRRAAQSSLQGEGVDQDSSKEPR